MLVQCADIIHVHKEKRWAIDFVPGSWGVAESKWHLKWVLTILNNKGSKMSKVWSFEITQCVIGNKENYSIWRKEGFEEKKSAFVKVAWSQCIKNSMCHMDLIKKIKKWGSRKLSISQNQKLFFECCESICVSERQSCQYFGGHFRGQRWEAEAWL